MDTALLTVATLCYGVGTAGYLIYLFRDRHSIHRLAAGLLLLGALCHAGAIALQSFAEGHLAVASPTQALSFFAWILVVTYLAAQVRLNLRIFGSFVSPLAVVFMLASNLLPSRMIPADGILKSAWVVSHVGLLFLANALFALAFCAGIMYLLQERHIKQKQFGPLFPRLPSLDRLDRINHYCLLIGFPLMSIGLVAGFVYAGSVWRSPWNWDPKEIGALITWLIYAILLHERLAVGWRGRRAAWLAIFGFSAVLVTFLGVNLLLEGHHTVFRRQ
jgi:cytochrome c-type biogenesis protein CcsB